MSRNHLISALRHSLYRNHGFSETCAGCAHAEDVLVGADHQPRDSWLDLPWSMKHCGLSDVWLVTASGKEVAQVVFNHPDVDPEEVAHFISECVGGSTGRGVDGHAADASEGRTEVPVPAGTDRPSSVYPLARPTQGGRGHAAGTKPGRPVEAPTDGSQPADVLSPTSGTATASDGAAPAPNGHVDYPMETYTDHPEFFMDDQADGHAQSSYDYWTLARDLMRRDK